MYAAILFIPMVILRFFTGSPHGLYLLSRPALKLFFRILGVKVVVSGREYIPSPPFLLVCNHISYLDGPLMEAVTPLDLHVLIKAETRRLPLLGWIFQMADFVFVDRKSDRHSAEALLQAVAKIKKRGYAFLIFPEGTRSKTGKRLEFKRGGFMIAIKAGIPILPARVSGSYECLPPKTIWTKKGTVTVRFLPPLAASEVRLLDAESLCRQVESRYFGDMPREAPAT